MAAVSRPVESHSSGRFRSHVGAWAALLLASMTGCLGQLVVPATAIAAESPNLLDHARIDVAELESSGADGAPRILVVDPLDSTGRNVHLSILARDGTWSSMAGATIDVDASGVGDAGKPWLVGLGNDQFVLIATSRLMERSVLVPIDAREGDGRPWVVQGQPVRLDTAIDDAGAADVDGDGSLELVVANARTLRQGGTCQGSTIWVFHDGELARRSEFPVPDVRLAAGVLGSFDESPGDDLAVYAYPNCPAGPDVSSDLRLLSINLADGTLRSDRPAASSPVSAWVAPPVKFDADGDGRDELLGLVPRGLAVIDPLDDWSDIRVASTAAMPLGATSVAGPPGALRTRVAWLEPSIGGRGSVGTELVRREESGALDTGPATVRWDEPIPSDRWRALLADATIATLRQASPVAWTGSLGDPSCTDLLVPIVMVACGSDSVLPSATWVSTQPLFAFDAGAGRVLMVAAGTEQEFGSGLPASPRPWAGSAAGRWRHGPSASFALAEVEAADLADDVVPTPVLDRTAARGPIATVGARVGARLITTAYPRGAGAMEPVPGPLMGALQDLSPGSNGRAALIRIPVPPGVVSSAQGAVAEVSLAGLTLTDGTAPDRWAVFIVAIDDTGDIAGPVATMVALDIVGPTLEVAVPLTSPIWPTPARLAGTVEAGATVTVDGEAVVEMGERGAFEIETNLAPWPQTLRVVATDQVGNETVLEVTVVGGYDYRALPWPAILAVGVLAAAIVSGVVGSRRRRGAGATASSSPVGAGDPVPELEELPPRSGA